MTHLVIVDVDVIVDVVVDVTVTVTVDGDDRKMPHLLNGFFGRSVDYGHGHVYVYVYAYVREPLWGVCLLL